MDTCSFDSTIDQGARYHILHHWIKALVSWPPDPSRMSPSSTDHEKELSKDDNHDNCASSRILQEHEHPQHLPTWRKWLAVSVTGSASACVTATSSMVRLRLRILTHS